MPELLPSNTDWDFHVFPGVFSLYVDETISLLTRSIQEDRKHWLVMRLFFRAGWYQVYRNHFRLVALLKHGHTITDQALHELQSPLWCLAANMIWPRNFFCYKCPICLRRFEATTGYAYHWTHGEGLAASGGRRFTCPNQHMLYSIMEWNS